MPMNEMNRPTADAPAPRRRAAVAALAVVSLFLLFAVPLILFTPDGNRAGADEAVYHLPAVRQFQREWPRFDFRTYTSATTPGYHLALAAVARFVGDDVRLLRAAGALFTVGLLATAAAALARRVGARAAVVLALPLLCSSYVFKAGVWILPENAGWWGVLAVLLLALRPRVDVLTYAAGGALLAALVFFRQMHIWSASVLWLAAWLGSNGRSDFPDVARRDSTSSPPPVRADSPLTGPFLPRMTRATLMVLASLPAFLVVGYFVRLWGGMVPEHYRIHGETRTGSVYMDGGNPAAPAMILGLMAAFGPFFLPLAWRHIRESIRSDRRALWLVAAGAVVGATIGIFPETSYDMAAGRWSGLWNLVARLPTFHNRSALIVTLSTLGGATIALWLLALPRRDRWLFLAAWSVFALAQSFSSMAWQRYYEPFLLMTLALAAARACDDDRPGDIAPPHRLALAGPLLLAVLLAGVTVMTLR